MLRSLKDLEAVHGDCDRRRRRRRGEFPPGRRALGRSLFGRRNRGSFGSASRAYLSHLLSSRRLGDPHLRLGVDAVTEIKNSPSIDVDRPVSRQHEREYYGYYGYPYYWGYMAPWGASAYPALLAAGKRTERPVERADDKTSGDIHLRSANEVRGYHIQGSDGAIGHIEDFIVDDESWEVRYLVVDTKNWWFGKKSSRSTALGERCQLGRAKGPRRSVSRGNQEEPRVEPDGRGEQRVRDPPL